MMGRPGGGASIGASSDLDAATRVAYGMVTRFGMSDRVGPVAHHDEDWARTSGETKAAIDGEVRRLLDESRARAATLLATHKEELHRLAAALCDYETLTREEIEMVVQGRPLARARVPPPKTADEAVPTPAAAPVPAPPHPQPRPQPVQA
jgi:ATP-dependent metalloprotease